MKHTVVLAALGLVAVGATAQEVVGNVISTSPVIQQVAVPRTSCAPGYAQAQPETSGAGGIVGGLTGAALGSAIGAGTGNAVAIAGGAILGAIAGNHAEATGIRQQQAAVPNCVTETTYENRTVGYNVTYEFGGRQYTTQMPYDPGNTVRLQVSPVGQSAPGPAMAGAVTAPVAVAATPVYVQPYAAYPAPVYAYPYPYPYPYSYSYPYPYPYYRPWPVGVSIGFVGHFGGHRGGWHHR